jgi:hypothetical protein
MPTAFQRPVNSGNLATGNKHARAEVAIRSDEEMKMNHRLPGQADESSTRRMEYTSCAATRYNRLSCQRGCSMNRCAVVTANSAQAAM